MAGKKQGRPMPPKMPRPETIEYHDVEKIEEGYYIPGPGGAFNGSHRGSCREIAKQLIVKIAKDNRLASSGTGYIDSFWISMKPEIRCSLDSNIRCNEGAVGISKSDLINQINEELKELKVLIPFS